MISPPPSIISHPVLSQLPGNHPAPLSPAQLESFGYSILSLTLTSGFPATIPLANDLTLLLTVPTGNFLHWKNLPDQPLHNPSSTPDSQNPGSPIPTFLLKRGNSLLGTAPLNAHHCTRFTSGPSGNSTTPSYILEIIPLDWQFHTADMRGPNDSKSHIQIAWRTIHTATDSFQITPAPLPVLARAGLAHTAPDLPTQTLHPTPQGYHPHPI